MKDTKAWLILGADVGLGAAAMKYLRANGQLVWPDTAFPPGPLDFIINNSNYHLFSSGIPDIDRSVAATIALLRASMPHLKTEGSIINIPPQLCLTTLADASKGPELIKAMDLFLTSLWQELRALDRRLNFLEPGERFVQL